jgi:hypothetical protein
MAGASCAKFYSSLRPAVPLNQRGRMPCASVNPQNPQNCFWAAYILVHMIAPALAAVSAEGA